MTLATTRVLVERAVDARNAVFAFNVITLEHAQGVVAGLERAGRPGIIQVSQRALEYHGRASAILSAVRSIADAAETPVAVHLDHITDLELAHRLIDSAEQTGATSIMIDFADLAREHNVEKTREATAEAQAAGLFVEAELGQVGGKDGAHASGARTDPDDAVRFVAETGVDALAVAIGSSHAMTARTAALDLELLERLTAAVSVPLVLHGSSGVPDAELAEAIAAGIRKINVGTALNVAYTDAVRRELASRPDLSDPRAYLREAREAVAGTVVDFCRVADAAANHAHVHTHDRKGELA